MRDFSPGDAELLKLARTSKANHRILSPYSVFDPHIPGGSYLEGAVKFELPTMAHFRPVGGPRLLATVERWVAATS